MSVVITESDMQFGKYPENFIFQIEDSAQYTEKLRQNGVRSCEFILRRGNNLCFVEAKTSCPNQITANSSEEKKIKYQEYIQEIVEKIFTRWNVRSIERCRKIEYAIEFNSEKCRDCMARSVPR